MRNLTLKLSDKIQKLISSGKIYLKDLPVESQKSDSFKNQRSGQSMILKAKTRGSPVQTGRDSAKKARKNLSCWDKEGGVDGLSVWIVYDFLTAKQKSVPWLSQWIHNLQGQQIMTIVEEAGRGQAHKMDDDEDDVEVSQDLNERLSGSDQSQRGHKVKFDVVDIDEYLLSTTQNKK